MRITIALARTVLGVCATLGGGPTAPDYQFRPENVYAARAGNAMDQVEVLRLLRGGDSSAAIEHLERQLDMSIIMLNHESVDLPAPDRDRVNGILRNVILKYRSEYPVHQPEESLREVVLKTFEQAGIK